MLLLLLSNYVKKKNETPFFSLHCWDCIAWWFLIEPPLSPPDHRTFVSNKGSKSNPEWRRILDVLLWGGFVFHEHMEIFPLELRILLQFSNLSTAAFNKILEKPIKAAKLNELYLQFDDSCAGVGPYCTS